MKKLLVEREFFNGMAAKVADIVIEKNIARDLELLAQHKKAKHQDHLARRCSPTCDVCLLCYPGDGENVHLCVSGSCPHLWCGRQTLCDASKFICSVCTWFVCNECSARLSKCTQCPEGTTVCPRCIVTCSQCGAHTCKKHSPVDELCVGCTRFEIMAIHYNH